MRVARLPSGSRRQAFTLIELLIVMAIIAVLVALTIPAVMKARESSNRAQCINNLKQLGLACQVYHERYGYYPTAGTSDYVAPLFSANGTPISGWQQDAGWAYQILPFLDADNVYNGNINARSGGGSAATNIDRMKNALSTPVRSFFCPTRRLPTTGSYKGPAVAPPFFPSQTPVYDSVHASAAAPYPVALLDYAGCNSTNPAGSVQNGMIRSQGAGRNTVRAIDVTDGAATTLMLGEKAGSTKLGGTILNEDDVGYASAYSGPSAGVNFNAIRFASSLFLPLNDAQVSGATGGAFGSAHAGTWNALMADGSVHSLVYTIDSNIFVALGTIAGKETISDADLDY